MKKTLCFMLLMCVFVSSAQTITWTGAGANTSWSTIANWNLGTVPTAANDVIIPTGKTVVIDVAGVTKSIQVQGNANVTISGGLSILNASGFSATSVVTWANGNISGGGILANAGTMNLTTGTTKSVIGTTVLNNTGTINVQDGGDFYISNAVVNNQTGGTIDLVSDQGNISWSGGGDHFLNNAGTIRKSTSVGSVTIEASVINSGTITVTAGNLALNDPNTVLTGGTYNIASGTGLILQNTITCSGILSGLVNGNFNLTSTFNIPVSATFNFTGTAGVNWSAGNIGGGGILTNSSALNLTTGATKSITGLITLNNASTINIMDGGDFYISNATTNNLAGGIIDLQSDQGNISWSGGGAHLLNNSGLIRKTISAGTVTIEASLKNTGTISVVVGPLLLNDPNIELNGGIYNVAALSALIWQSTITCSGTLTGLVNGEIDWTSIIAIPTTATFNFTGTTPLNWASGNLVGGGTLNVNSPINLTTASTKSVTALCTLNNASTISILDGGDFYISNATANNLATGIIDLKSEDGNISWSGGGPHLLNNSGIIRKTTSTGTVTIEASLKNTAAITVTLGTLIFNDPNIELTGGVYTVASGCVLRWQNTLTCAGNLTGVLGGTINMVGTVNIPVAATFGFTGVGGIDWSAGNVTGGGILTNNSLINLTTGNIKSITGLLTMNNAATVNILDGGDFYITNAVFNNQATGIIDMRSEQGNISWSGSPIHTLNNAGIIKKTTSTATAVIEASLKNTGTISVQLGTLVFNDPNIVLTGGVYNVTTGNFLQWANIVTCAGNLTGVANGYINLTATVSVPVAATFGFTGTSGMNWSSGNLTGIGTLTNASVMDLTTTATKNMDGGFTLSNTGTLNILDGGNLNLSVATINNQIAGTIDLKSDNGDITWSGGGVHTINNFGTMKKTISEGLVTIEPDTYNSGTFDIQKGTLSYYNPAIFNNNASGIVKGTGTLDLPDAANFTNNGTFAPGGSPGKLTLIGDYKSTATSKIAVELNGMTQITQYDLLAIQGNGTTAGTVNVTLGFAPTVGNQFIIGTLTGTIATCNLAATTSATYNGYEYTFSVGCLDNNKIVLTVTQKTLGTNENTAIANKLLLAPNPANGFINLKNESDLELQNATIIDFSGRVIRQIDLNGMGSDKTISLNGLASGAYFMKITSASGTFTKRFILQ